MSCRIYSSIPGVAGPRCTLRAAWRFVGLLGVVPVALLAQEPSATPRAAAYHLTARWKPGGAGGGSRLTLDSQAHRLYVARADCMQIIDTENGGLVRSIPGLDDGRDVVLAPDVNRGFATSAGSDTVLVFDLTSLRPAGAVIQVGKQPDAVVYEPLTRHVFVFDGGSNGASVLEAATGAVLATVPLGGTPGAAAADAGGTVFVVLKDRNEVLAIDAQKNSVSRRWPLAPGAEPTSLALDSIRHRLYAGCRNGRLVVLDTRRNKHLAELLLGREVIACAVDPGSGDLFVSGGDGTLTVVRGEPAKPGEFRVVETLKTPPVASALAFDPGTRAIYLAGSGNEASPASEETPSTAAVPRNFVLRQFKP